MDAPILGVLVFLIGAKLTALYAVVTFFAAIGLAALLARLGFEKDIKEIAKQPVLLLAPVSGGASEAVPAAGCGVPAGSAPGCDVYAAEPDSGPAAAPMWRRAWGRVRGAWRRAWSSFVPIVPHLAIGAAIGAVFEAFVPTGWLLALAGPDQSFAIPLMATLGIPVHVMSSHLLPVAASLLDEGVVTGAVVAFVVTGLGISVPQLAWLPAVFRPRLIAALVLSNVIVAIGIGALLTLVAG